MPDGLLVNIVITVSSIKKKKEKNKEGKEDKAQSHPQLTTEEDEQRKHYAMNNDIEGSARFKSYKGVL